MYIIAGSVCAGRSTRFLVTGSHLPRSQVINIRAKKYPRATVHRSYSVGLRTYRTVTTSRPSISVVFIRSNKSGLSTAFDPSLTSTAVCIVTASRKSGVPHGKKPNIAQSSLLIVGGASVTSLIRTSLGIVTHSSREVHGNQPCLFASLVGSGNISSIVT